MRWKKGQYVCYLNHGSAGYGSYGYFDVQGPKESDDTSKVDWGRMNNPTKTFVGAFDSKKEAQEAGRKAYEEMRLK